MFYIYKLLQKKNQEEILFFPLKNKEPLCSFSEAAPKKERRTTSGNEQKPCWLPPFYACLPSSCTQIRYY